MWKFKLNDVATSADIYIVDISMISTHSYLYLRQACNVPKLQDAALLNSANKVPDSRHPIDIVAIEAPYRLGWHLADQTINFAYESAAVSTNRIRN